MEDEFDPINAVESWLDRFYLTEKMDESGEKEYFTAEAERFSIDEMDKLRAFVARVKHQRDTIALLREALAAYAHDQAWAGWMKYLFSKSKRLMDDDCPRCGDSSDDHFCPPARPDGVKIPQELVERWTRQMNTPYDELPEGEKKSDRDEADKMLKIMGMVPPETQSITEFVVRKVKDWAEGKNSPRDIHQASIGWSPERQVISFEVCLTPHRAPELCKKIAAEKGYEGLKDCEGCK